MNASSEILALVLKSFELLDKSHHGVSEPQVPHRLVVRIRAVLVNHQHILGILSFTVLHTNITTHEGLDSIF